MAESQPTPERWLPVVGYEGIYEVSDMGRVRSLDRVATVAAGWHRSIRGRILKPGTVRGHHQYVNLARPTEGSAQSRPRSTYVHVLVAEAFLGPRPEGAHILHWNDDGSDNRVSNLRYGTASENMHDRTRNGRSPQAEKTACLRGHEFTPKNTRPNGHPNRRGCIACSRARAYIQRNPHLKPHLQQVADDYYARITA